MSEFVGVRLSGAALSAGQIGKHFNGFLPIAPLTALFVSRRNEDPDKYEKKTLPP